MTEYTVFWLRVCVYACVSCVHRYGVPQQNYAPVAANTYHPGGANAYRVVKQPCSDNPVTLTCQRTVSAAMCNCLLVPLVPHVHVMVRAACSPPPVASGVDAQCTDPARECVFTCSPGLLVERGSPVGVCHRGTASFIGSAPLRCYGTSPLPLFRAVFATLIALAVRLQTQRRTFQRSRWTFPSHRRSPRP